jgi:hypothetical protein
VTVGGVLSEAWRQYREHWRHLIPIALIFYAVVQLLTLILALALGWVGALLGVIVSFVGFFWLQGALVEAVADIRDGRADLSIGETFQRVRPRLAALMVAGVLAGLGIAVGLLLLIIPGLVLLTWWCLIAPVIVLEGKRAGESFSRSRELVSGHGWTCFGVIIITLVLLAVVAGIVGGILSAALPDWVANYISNVVVYSVLAPWSVLAFTTMYFQLREPQVAPSELSPTAA